MVFPSTDIQQRALFGNLSLDEISQILDVTETPSLLVSSQDGQIRAGNLTMVELSGYTREELGKFKVQRLFPGIEDIWENETERLKLQSKAGIYGTLITRRKRAVKVRLESRKIGNQARFVLLEITPLLENSHLAIGKDTINLEACFQLTRAFSQTSVESALEVLVQTGQKLLGAKAVVVYNAFSNHPVLKKVASAGEDKLLPDSISNSDLVTYYKELVYGPPYPSLLPPFQKIAVENRVSFFVSAPLRVEKKLMGVIVILGASGTASLERKAPLLHAKFLAAAAEAAINNLSQIKNLREELNKGRAENLVERQLSKHIQEGVIYLKPDLTIEKVNQATELILGYVEDEILNHPFDDVLIGANRLDYCLNEALEGIHTPRLGNIKLHRRDGSVFSANIKVIPVVNHQTGQVLRILLFVSDMSKEEQNRLQNQHLERRALVGDMNAIFAHEIKNPINNIITGIQLLEQILPEGFSDEKIIKGLHEDSKRLTHIIDTILNYSRSQSSEKTNIDMPALVKQILTRWRPRMKRVGIKYHIKADSKLPLIFGERRALEQVFTNLITNAVQSMEKNKGGVLAIHMKSIQTLGKKQAIKIDILDTGAGIPESAREHIFEPFFTTKTEGTGLGLSISKQIITKHKGSITFTHLPDGIVFHIILPAKNEA